MPGINEKAPKSRYSSTKFWLYSISFFLLFALTVSELGLVSQLLHNGGNNDSNYPSMEFKHDLGLLLFACIATLLYIIGHYWASLGMAAFISFCLAVFWGTGAGVLFAVTPFESFTCGNPQNSFPTQWQSYAHNCSRVVAIQGIAWALWALLVLMFFGMIGHIFQFKRRQNVSFYNV